MSHGDPKNPKHNPHPVKRYEVIATADAPGPWDSVAGTVFFDVTNKDCTPEDNFLGVHATPKDVAIEFEMIRSDDNKWIGYFYRDSIIGDNYYGIGICHWDVSSLSIGFIKHGSNFMLGMSKNEFNKEISQVEYFRRSDFFDTSKNVPALSFSATDSDVAKQPDAFFEISIKIKEISP